jgi:hypothetical protein
VVVPVNFNAFENIAKRAHHGNSNNYGKQECVLKIARKLG